MLAGIALAGGRSSRMGQDKSLLSMPNQDITLLTHCQQLLAGVGQIQVWVSGIQHQQGLADVYANCGPISGIHGVLSYFANNQPQITEVLFVPVDMPALSIDDLQWLVEQGRQLNTFCYYEDHYFPLYMPMSTAFLTDIEQQLANEAKQQTVSKNRQLSLKNVLTRFSAKPIPVTNQSSLININTPLQWQQHCEAHRIRGK